ncbi:hypothetical protein J2S09_001411 [Bacillus fengqiuensis]|nr:hypothetical protein [Bacillus fengqiuensis]
MGHADVAAGRGALSRPSFDQGACAFLIKQGVFSSKGKYLKEMTAVHEHTLYVSI